MDQIYKIYNQINIQENTYHTSQFMYDFDAVPRANRIENL